MYGNDINVATIRYFIGKTLIFPQSLIEGAFFSNILTR